VVAGGHVDQAGLAVDALADQEALAARGGVARELGARAGAALGGGGRLGGVVVGGVSPLRGGAIAGGLVGWTWASSPRRVAMSSCTARFSRWRSALGVAG